MNQFALGVYITAAYQRDVKHMVDPVTPREWMEVACFAKGDPIDVQRRVGRKVLEGCSVEQLKTWTDTTSLI